MVQIDGQEPFTEAWRPGWFGWTKNRPFQAKNSTGRVSNFTLSIIEFDDQGRCFSRYQLKNLFDTLATFKDQNPFIVLFAHGWKHNGSSGDDNLINFASLLEYAATVAGNRPVVGVFLAWRGLSFYSALDVFTSVFSFLSRKQAALRVAMGAPRELLERLRRFKDDEKGNATLIVIGHSFGGLVVFNAIAQSLIRSAIDPSDKTKVFADLVLLVNPAFEGVRYLPIHDLVREEFDVANTAHHHVQLPANDDGVPTFASVTSVGDIATGYAFPLGMLLSRLREKARGAEREALSHTMGHIKAMQTHTLSLRNAADQEVNAAPAVRIRFSADNPFWVLEASADLIPDHNRIWGTKFREWVKGLLAPHLADVRPVPFSPPSQTPAEPTPQPPLP